MKNNPNLHSELFKSIENYLMPFALKDIQLILEAINENFKVITDKDGNKLSKDWGNAFDIYQSITKIIVEYLFSYSDGNGFPDAKIFTKIYLDDIMNPTIKDICVYFLRKKLNSFSNE
jgi:hypothetical protein